MLLLWSPKGGVGTTTVVAGLAAHCFGRIPVLIVDLGGDVAAMLGCEPPETGWGDWVTAQAAPASGALIRSSSLVAPDVRLLAPGRVGQSQLMGRFGGRVGRTNGWPSSDGLEGEPGHADARTSSSAFVNGSVSRAFWQQLSGFDGMVIIDAADGRHLLVDWFTVHGAQVWMTMRGCYLGMRRAAHARTALGPPDGIVWVSEAGRAIRSADAQKVLRAPVVADVPWRPAIARAVDAGLILRRPPEALSRALAPAWKAMLGHSGLTVQSALTSDAA